MKKKAKKIVANIKRDARERFLNFESVNGAFIFLPWGVGFIYCGLFNQKLGYGYGMISLGACLIIWGLRKIFVNRIKKAVKEKKLVMNEEFSK